MFLVMGIIYTVLCFVFADFKKKMSIIHLLDFIHLYLLRLFLALNSYVNILECKTKQKNISMYVGRGGY